MHTVCKFECIGKVNSKVMKMIDYNIFYFASEFEILDPTTPLMFLIGLELIPFVDYFSSTLSSSEG